MNKYFANPCVYIPMVALAVTNPVTWKLLVGVGAFLLLTVAAAILLACFVGYACFFVLLVRGAWEVATRTSKGGNRWRTTPHLVAAPTPQGEPAALFGVSLPAPALLLTAERKADVAQAELEEEEAVVSVAHNNLPVEGEEGQPRRQVLAVIDYACQDGGLGSCVNEDVVDEGVAEAAATAEPARSEREEEGDNAALLSRLTDRELLALAKESGVKGASARWKRETLLTALQKKASETRQEEAGLEVVTSCSNPPVAEEEEGAARGDDGLSALSDAELLALAKERKVKGASARWKRETLLARLRGE